MQNTGTFKGLKLRASRSNYHKHRLAFLNYQRTRKKTNRKEKKLRKQLLKYLLRLIQCFDELIKRQSCKLKAKNRKLIATIEKVYEQQHELTYGTQSVTDRIVSLHKPCLRPIVRGKETKRASALSNISAIITLTKAQGSKALWPFITSILASYPNWALTGFMPVTKTEAIATN